MNESSTRRSLLKLATGAAAYGAGAATLSLGAAVATATNTAKAATSTDLELTALIATYNRAAEEADTFETEVHEPARVRSLAAADAVPQLEHNTRVISMMGNEIVWRTDDAGVIAMLRRIKADGSLYGGDLLREATTFLPMVEARESQVALARTKSGVEQTLPRAQELGDRCCDAIDAVAEYPVATIDDLAVKIEFMRRIDSEYFSSVANDIFRLAGREG